MKTAKEKFLRRQQLKANTGSVEPQKRLMKKLAESNHEILFQRVMRGAVKTARLVSKAMTEEKVKKFETELKEPKKETSAILDQFGKPLSAVGA